MWSKTTTTKNNTETEEIENIIAVSGTGSIKTQSMTIKVYADEGIERYICVKRQQPK